MLKFNVLTGRMECSSEGCNATCPIKRWPLWANTSPENYLVECVQCKESLLFRTLLSKNSVPTPASASASSINRQLRELQSFRPAQPSPYGNKLIRKSVLEARSRRLTKARIPSTQVPTPARPSPLEVTLFCSGVLVAAGLFRGLLGLCGLA